MEFKFGKYKGKTFEYARQDSPSYFIWLWNEINSKLDSNIYSYIEENLIELKKESINEHIDFMEESCDGEVCVPH